MEEKKPKRTYRKKDQLSDVEVEALFTVAMGAFTGMFVGMAQIEKELQILGKPHDEKMCLLGKLCPTHASSAKE